LTQALRLNALEEVPYALGLIRQSLMDRVVEDREVVMVRRRQGGDVALVAADELEGLLETAHLLRSPRNAARLLSALERARGDSLPALRLEDLEAQLEA
jgi:antitoxin YefM